MFHFVLLSLRLSYVRLHTISIQTDPKSNIKGPQMVILPNADRNLQFVLEKVTRLSLSRKFWFCSKPICCQTNTLWLLGQSNGRDNLIYTALLKAGGVVRPNSIEPYCAVTFFFKSRDRSHRQPNPSRRHPASQRRTPEDLNVRYTAERTSPVTHSNQWPVSRHIIMSPAAHCSRGGAS